MDYIRITHAHINKSLLDLTFKYVFLCLCKYFFIRQYLYPDPATQTSEIITLIENEVKSVESNQESLGDGLNLIFRS